MLCNSFFFGLWFDTALVNLRPFVFVAVDLDPVIYVVDMDGIEAPSFGPRVIAPNLENDLLGGLLEYVTVVRAVGHVEKAVVVQALLPH